MVYRGTTGRRFARCSRHTIELRSRKSPVRYLTLETYQIAHPVTKTVKGAMITAELFSHNFPNPLLSFEFIHDMP
jgi:hypothetical protein